MIYIIVFIISILLLKLAENKSNKKTKFILFFSMIIPCIIAGIRGNSVGTDINWYVVPNFERALLSNSFLKYIINEDIEILYSSVVYFCAKLFGSVNALLFIIQFLISLPIYIVIYKNKSNISMWKMGLIYYFMIYNYSYSLMRQCISGSLILLGLQFLIDKNKKKGFIMFIFAIMFHKTSMLVVLIVITIAEIDYVRKSKKLQLFLVIIYGVLISNINRIISILGNAGLIDKKYIERMIFYEVTHPNGTFKLLFMIFIAIIALIILAKNKNNELAKYNSFHILTVISIFFNFAGALISQYLGRVTYYFYFFYIVSIPMFFRVIKGKTPFDQFVLRCVYIIAFLVFWMKIFLIDNSFDVFPFVTCYMV